MATFLVKAKNVFVEEDGQGMAEYGLILGAIAVVVIGALLALGDEAKELYDEISLKLREHI